MKFGMFSQNLGGNNENQQHASVEKQNQTIKKAISALFDHRWRNQATTTAYAAKLSDFLKHVISTQMVFSHDVSSQSF